MSDGVRATWLGHATVDVTVGGTRLLTDPVLGMRLAHLRRRGPRPVVAPGAIDAVLISHLHHDHLDLPSLRRLPPGPVVVPRGAGRLVAASAQGEVVEVVPGDVLRFADAVVRVVPADHDGRRTFSRASGPPLGFVVEAAGQRIYFAGDTDRFDQMADFGPVDLALLPIWGWGSSIGPGHLDPRRAAEAAALVRAADVLPVHWGTFSPVRLRSGAPAWLTAPGDSFAAVLPLESPETRLHLLRPGEQAMVAGWEEGNLP